MDTTRDTQSAHEEFGYRPSLEGTLGRWATFAATISFISILTAAFQMFGFGLAVAGPAFWWTLPVVAIGQMAVALVFAELASRWPVAGSVYNWAKKLSSPGWAWMTGWVYLLATIVVVASVALALQAVLPAISSSFQIIGDGTGPNDYSANAVLLGGIGLLLATLVNLVKVRILSLINGVGVFVEILAVVVLIGALLANAQRSPAIVMETAGTGTGHSLGYLGALLIASLAPAYALFGFDTAAALGEESTDPARNAPKSVLQAPLASAVLGMLLLFGALMSAKSLTSEGVVTGGLAFIVTDVLGETFGTLMLCAVVVAIFVCLMSIQASAIRMTFAMSRDNNLPFGSILAKVSQRSKTPTVPAIVVGVLAFGILFLNMRQPRITLVVVTMSVFLIYVAYLMVTGLVLMRRLRGEWSRPVGRFDMGSWGVPVTAVAVVWGMFMTVNLSWPRREIFNPSEPFHWYLQYGAWLSGALIIGGGALYYFTVQRHKTAILAEHSLVPPQGGASISERT